MALPAPSGVPCVRRGEGHSVLPWVRVWDAPRGMLCSGAGVSTLSIAQGKLMAAVAHGDPHLSALAVGGGTPKDSLMSQHLVGCRSGSRPERRGCGATVSGHRASAGTDTSLRPQPGSQLTLHNAETFPNVQRQSDSWDWGCWGELVRSAVEWPGVLLDKAQDAPRPPHTQRTAGPRPAKELG